MRRTLPSLLGFWAWLFAVTTAAASTTTQLVLSPDQPTAAAIAEDPTLADRTTFDLRITTTAGWTNSSLKFALSDGSFYNAGDGGNVPTMPGQWGTPGLRHLRYDTFVAAPPDFAAMPMVISRHPSDGGGAAIFSSGTVSVLWADTSTSYGPGTYTIARLTVSNDAVGSFFGSAFDNSLPGTAQPFNGAINKQLRWDTDPLTSGAQGGTGTWDTAGGGFWNGAANVAWDNARNDVAIFGASAGTVTVGAVTASALRFDAAGYTLSGGAITLTGSGHVTTNQDATIGSTIASAVGLTKRGPATLTLSGANTYTGGTRVCEGNLDVFGSVCNAAGGVVEVSGGSMVTFYGPASGPGNFPGSGSVRFLGGYSPGNSPGVIAFGGDLTLGGANKLTMELAENDNTNPACPRYDELNVAHNISIGGELDLVWTPRAGDVTSKFGGTYDLITYVGQLDGTFSVKCGFSAYIAGINYAADAGGGRKAVRLTLYHLLDGDADLDGQVTRNDLAAVGAGFPCPSPAWQDGDFDMDGRVTPMDYLAVKENWGRTASGGPVPEPATLALLAAGAAALLRRRKRRSGPERRGEKPGRNNQR
jgi:autotransporter-associated beta strand protein